MNDDFFLDTYDSGVGSTMFSRTAGPIIEMLGMGLLPT